MPFWTGEPFWGAAERGARFFVLPTFFGADFLGLSDLIAFFARGFFDFAFFAILVSGPSGTTSLVVN